MVSSVVSLFLLFVSCFFFSSSSSWMRSWTSTCSWAAWEERSFIMRLLREPWSGAVSVFETLGEVAPELESGKAVMFTGRKCNRKLKVVGFGSECDYLIVDDSI